MQMRIVAVLLLVAFGGLAAAVPADARASTCPKGGKKIVASEHARVWQARLSSGISRYYGCAYRVGKSAARAGMSKDASQSEWGWCRSPAWRSG